MKLGELTCIIKLLEYFKCVCMERILEEKKILKVKVELGVKYMYWVLRDTLVQICMSKSDTLGKWEN